MDVSLEKEGAVVGGSAVEVPVAVVPMVENLHALEAAPCAAAACPVVPMVENLHALEAAPCAAAACPVVPLVVPVDNASDVEVTAVT